MYSFLLNNTKNDFRNIKHSNVDITITKINSKATIDPFKPLRPSIRFRKNRIIRDPNLNMGA